MKVLTNNTKGFAMDLANFSALATAVFNEPSFEGKREACSTMIEQMRSPEKKKAFFRRQLSVMTVRQMDKFAADCFLVDTDKVIR